jgi:hypothetical protein
MYMHLSIYLSICLSIYLSVYLSVYLSIHLYIYKGGTCIGAARGAARTLRDRGGTGAIGRARLGQGRARLRTSPPCRRAALPRARRWGAVRRLGLRV